jgi:hypothetical protein
MPIVQFTPPQGSEYVVGNFVSNFWRTQLSLRYSFRVAPLFNRE